MGVGETGCILGLSSPTLPLEEVWPGVERSGAGGIFILEQLCGGGLVQELSVTAAAGEDLCWLPKLTPGQGTRPGGGHGSPRDTAAPTQGPAPSQGCFCPPHFEP